MIYLWKQLIGVIHDLFFKVVDEAGASLQGVLLSLSGVSQYRSNKLTQEDGTMNFLSLVSQWYIHILKTYPKIH